MNRYLLPVVLAFVLVSSFFSNLSAKVFLITHSYNRPDFIEIQYKTFNRFLKDDYEFVVFNDAPDMKMENQIVKMCQKYAIKCIRIPQTIHDMPYLPHEGGFNSPHARCANVVQYSLDTFGFDCDGIVAIIDSDLFLIHDFSIEEYMNGYDIAAWAQDRGKVQYIWNGIVFLDMRRLPNKRTLNFNCGTVEDETVDVGGYTYYYFQQNPTVAYKMMNGLYMKRRAYKSLPSNLDSSVKKFLRRKPDNIEFFIDFAFLHYRSGANWNKKSSKYHEKKTKLFNHLIHDLLKNRP